MGVPKEGFFDEVDVVFVTLLLLPLRMKFLPKLLPLPPSRYPEKRVLILRGLVRPHLFLPKHLILQKESFLL